MFLEVPIKRLRPPIGSMIITETCKKVREKIKNKKVVTLHCHGAAGSGKSEIIRKMGEEFPFVKPSNNNKILIKWHIQCKDSGHDVRQELKLLAERLLQRSYRVSQELYQNTVDNLDLDEANELVDMLVKINVPVLIMVEDPPSKDQANLLRSLCKCLNDYSRKIISARFHVYISTRENHGILPSHQDIPCYNSVLVTGFNEDEAIKCLSEGLPVDQKKATIKIFKHFDGLPIGLRVAKAYCQKLSISYEDYIELVEDVDYDITPEERKAVMKMYGTSALHVFHAIVMPFMPRNKDDKVAVLYWKILCCISYFHYDRIPCFALEQSCHILAMEQSCLQGNVKRPSRIENKIDVGNLILKLEQHSMCRISDMREVSEEREITFHEVILSAFRLNKCSIVSTNFRPLEKAVEIMSSLVSKDMRKTGHSRKMYKMRRHLQSLLNYIENDTQIFKGSNDVLLSRALTSYLHETAAAIMLNEKSSWFWKEADQHFKKALEHIWPEMTKYLHLESLTGEETVEEIAQKVVAMSKSKGEKLPSSFTKTYASKLEFSLEEDEINFLKLRSTSNKNFAEAIKLYREEGSFEDLLTMLQKCDIFLADDVYQVIFYAERFAFILHSSSRLVLYGDPSQVKEVGQKCICLSNLSKQICIECTNKCGVLLLAKQLSQTSGWIPISLKLKRSTEDLEKALITCREAMYDQYNDDLFENGMRKEVHGPSHNATRISLLRHIVRINARLHSSSDSSAAVTEADRNCEELFKLSKDHAKEISSSLNCFIYCAKYYAAKGEFDKAFQCFQEFFEREQSCVPRFDVICWATFNYARAVTMSENCSCEHVTNAFRQCTKLLQSNNVIKKSLMIGLKSYLKAIEIRLGAESQVSFCTKTENL